MDFEVTATRKRPKTLADLVGQDFVADTLSHALGSGQIAPAYLCYGPRGTGKTSTARILARSLNCVSGPTSTPCGQCDSCREIITGTSPDVIEIDGASHTGVNDVRQIKDELLYAPHGKGKKIYVIDEVHMLSGSAFNALLKTIEEPPPYVVFVFATTEIHKVPATIRSRCQQFRFSLISPEIIREKLDETMKDIGHDAEPDALNWIAREAAGSLRDAYTLLDQVISFSGGTLSLEHIRDKMGLAGFDTLSGLVNAAAGGNNAEALNILHDTLQSGTGVEQVLKELSGFLHNLLLLACGIEQESLLGTAPARFPELPRKVWSREQLEMAAEDAFALYRDMRYSLNSRYELELFVSRLCSLEHRISPADITRRIMTLRKELREQTGTGRETVRSGNVSPSDTGDKVQVSRVDSQVELVKKVFGGEEITMEVRHD